MWGAISRRSASDFLVFTGIMKATFYCEAILEGTLKPFLQAVYPTQHGFMQDNDVIFKSSVAGNVFGFHTKERKVKERWMRPLENYQAILHRLDDHLQGSHGLKRQSEEMKAAILKAKG